MVRSAAVVRVALLSAVLAGAAAFGASKAEAQGYYAAPPGYYVVQPPYYYYPPPPPRYYAPPPRVYYPPVFEFGWRHDSHRDDHHNWNRGHDGHRH
jgi:hypothetical protein